MRKYCFAIAAKIGWHTSNTFASPPPSSGHSATLGRGRAAGNCDVQDLDPALYSHPMEAAANVSGEDGAHLDHDASGIRAGDDTFGTLIDAQHRFVRWARQEMITL